MTRKPNGFTMIEALLSVGIVALLLTAVATAVYSSIQNHSQNEHVAALTQTARSILSRMMNQVRAASQVDSSSSTLTVTAPDGSVAQYQLTGGTFYYRYGPSGTATTQTVLLPNGDEAALSAFSIVREYPVGYPAPQYTRSVTVRMVLTAGSQSFPLTASAAVRRNQTY